jgi:hypothetical protein
MRTGFPHAFCSASTSAVGGDGRADESEIPDALEAEEAVDERARLPLREEGEEGAGKGMESMRTCAERKVVVMKVLRSCGDGERVSAEIGARAWTALWRAAMLLLPVSAGRVEEVSNWAFGTKLSFERLGV